MARDRSRKAPKARETAGLLPVKRVPGKAGQLLPDDDRFLIIRFNQVDLDGPWPLSAATPDELKRVFQAVAQLETMTPLEVFKGYPGKDYKTAELPTKEARDRLLSLQRDDQDIACLRLNGPGRLWGFRRGRCFHILWWDPGHEVWPSQKKHT